MVKRLLERFRSRLDGAFAGRLDRCCRRFLLLLCGGAAIGAWPAALQAGGGPENVLLVVNSRSWASQTIANYYIQFRGIPVRQVVYLDWSERLVNGAKIDAFRDKILIPVLQNIEARGLGNQIDYVIYSADFPTNIDLKADIGQAKLPDQLAPVGSLNSLTYYFQFVVAKSPNYLQIGIDNQFSNQFFRRPQGSPPTVDTRGFRSWYGWNGQGETVEAGGLRYLLSTMLGVTWGKGNSVSEVVAYLKSARAADGTHPPGSIYFMDNADPRSSQRKAGPPAFSDAATELQKMKIKAQIESGVMPAGRNDVQGLVMGSEKFSWAESKSRIRPGAICEHLTSYGAMFDDMIRQTPLTEFLRYGAAGASGTVIEPYLILQKFPSPFVQVHYARGASLAEAFYQSVAGPYQLLIVGDALCQPWANIPRVGVTGVKANSEVKGALSLIPAAQVPNGGAVHRYVLYADGMAVADATPGEPLTFDSTRLIDGYHELTVVAIENSAIEAQGRLTIPVLINNQGAACTLAMAAPAKSIAAGTPLKLNVSAPGATKIVVMHNTRALGVVEGASGSLDVNTGQFGFGPIQLHAVAQSADRELATSAPLAVNVRPIPSFDPVKPAGALRPGFTLTLPDGSKKSITDTVKGEWLETAGVKPQQEFTITGYVTAPIDDIYQFLISHFGTAQLSVDNKLVYEGSTLTDWPTNYVPVPLKPGKHLVELKGRVTNFSVLDFRFGGPGAIRAGDKTFEHE